MAKPTNHYKKRVVFRIELTVDAKERLLGISDELGITQIAVTSRIIEWFASQENTVQAGILGLYPDVIKKEVTTMILEKMANQD